MKDILIVYWSGTGNTEKMANLVGQGVMEAGAKALVKSVSETSVEDIEKFDTIAFGCPSMGNEVLEECEMEPFVESVESKIKGKKIALFGSYGWGDGQWMRDWVERMEGCGANVVGEGLAINYEPDADGEAQCMNLGKDLVS